MHFKILSWLKLILSTGGTANAVICLLVAVFAYVLRRVHIHENKKLEKAESEAAGALEGEEGAEGRSVGFRYIY